MMGDAYLKTVVVDVNDHYIIRLRNANGGLRPWSATLMQGVFYLGEAGASTYRSRSKRGCIRKAMRTVTAVASSNARPFAVGIEEP